MFAKLTKDVPPSVFSALDEFHKKNFGEDFPGKETVTSLSVKLDSRGAQEIRTESVGGCRFHKFDEKTGSKVYGLEFHPDQVAVILGDYSCWSEDGPRVRDYLERSLKALKVCGYDGSVTQIGMNVSDIFMLNNVASEWTGQLLNPKSCYLPSVVFGGEMYWHSNTGFFRKIEGHRQAVLNNINLAATNNTSSKKDVFRINTVHELVLDQVSGLDDAGQLFDRFMNEFHKYNKEIVSDVLAVDVAKEIGILD